MINFTALLVIVTVLYCIKALVTQVRKGKDKLVHDFSKTSREWTIRRVENRVVDNRSSVNPALQT